MKTNKWILAMLSALSLQAGAVTITEAQNKINDQLRQLHTKQKIRVSGAATTPGNGGTSPTPIPPPPPPIRQAAVKVRVIKTVLTQNSSGGFDATDSDVCITATTFNVYDVRHADGIAIAPGDEDRLQCHSDVGGIATTIHVGGVVALMNQNLFGSSQDFKTSIPMLTYDTPQTPGGGAPNGGIQAAMSVAGTTDMASRSLLTSLSSIQGITCSSDPSGGINCAPTSNTYFSAVIDVQD